MDEEELYKKRRREEESLHYTLEGAFYIDLIVNLVPQILVKSGLNSHIRNIVRTTLVVSMVCFERTNLVQRTITLISLML